MHNVEISKNTPPEFSEKFNTNFNMVVGDVQIVQIPEIKDAEGHEFDYWIEERFDKKGVLMTYPEFMFFDKDARTLTFRPDHKKYGGRSRYFVMKIKEKNSFTSDLINEFPCVVNVAGELWNPNDDKDWVDVYYRMTPLGGDSKAALIFKEPLNLSFVADHLTEIFDFYVKNNTFRTHNTTHPVLDVEVDSITEDGLQLNFTVTFSEPYLLGLLKKIPDKLYVHLKGGELLTSAGILKDPYMHQMVPKGEDPLLYRFYHEKCMRDRLKEASASKRMLQDYGDDPTPE